MIESGLYALMHGTDEVGHITRLGPDAPTATWEASDLNGWRHEFRRKYMALDALVTHISGRGIETRDELTRAGGFHPADATPPPVVETTPTDYPDDWAHTPQPDIYDIRRWTTLGWHETLDRTALARGMALNMLHQPDTYDLSFSQRESLSVAAGHLTRALDALRDGWL